MTSFPGADVSATGGWSPNSSSQMVATQSRRPYGTSARPVAGPESRRREPERAKALGTNERSASHYQIFTFDSGDEIPVCVQTGGGKFYLDPESDSWKTLPLAWYGHGKFFNCSSTRAEEVFQFNRFRKELDRRREMMQTIDKLEERLEVSESHRRRMVRDSLNWKQKSLGSKVGLSGNEWQRTQTELQAKAEECLCKVCFEADLDVLLMPCRHLVVCEKCSALLDTCPTCRGHIESVERVYRT